MFRKMYLVITTYRHKNQEYLLKLGSFSWNRLKYNSFKKKMTVYYNLNRKFKHLSTRNCCLRSVFLVRYRPLTHLIYYILPKPLQTMVCYLMMYAINLQIYLHTLIKLINHIR